VVGRSADWSNRILELVQSEKYTRAVAGGAPHREGVLTAGSARLEDLK